MRTAPALIVHEAKSSRTAFGVAMRTAAHQIFDSPRVLDDSLTMQIIGAELAAHVMAGSAEHSGVVWQSLY